MDQLNKFFWIFMFLYSFSSCERSHHSTTNEIFFQATDLKENFNFGDFTFTIQEGSVARQKMIPAPRFLQARFAELGIVPPSKILITYFIRDDSSQVDLNKMVQFGFFTPFVDDSIFELNKETRISFTKKYTDDLDLELIFYEGFCDYFGYEIIFTRAQGTYTERSKFLRVGKQSLFLHENGNGGSKYKILLNDTIIKKGYDENTVLYYDTDSLKRQILD